MLSWTQNLKKIGILNKMRSKFEPNWVNLVFKPTFTLKILYYDYNKHDFIGHMYFLKLS
jgi:hypothetical protein